ncbi:GNAT family N-acetyltransferase [Rugamonas sp.]|uniref:GNAT family N-acetyltransferase n=1 Tax=Rugamonas sp. TaxID=1926287 RepID=UPI0025DFBC2D|nr:GNAT family N-acetyltransferase [Rugamonas sp.]
MSSVNGDGRPSEQAAKAVDIAAVDIIDYAPHYAADFKRLNIDWLERFFYVEQIDNTVLSDPQRHILDPGGAIFLARLGGEIIGACALIAAGDGALELSKMAVAPHRQGLGVGRRLIERAIAAYQAGPATRLFLESNSKLEPAIRLYLRAGFAHAPKPAAAEAHYERADVYMEWRG